MPHVCQLQQAENSANALALAAGGKPHAKSMPSRKNHAYSSNSRRLHQMAPSSLPFMSAPTKLGHVSPLPSYAGKSGYMSACQAQRHKIRPLPLEETLSQVLLVLASARHKANISALAST